MRLPNLLLPCFLFCAQVTIWSTRTSRGLMNQQWGWIMAGAPVSLRVMTSTQTPRASHGHAARWEQAQVELVPKWKAAASKILSLRSKQGAIQGISVAEHLYFFIHFHFHLILSRAKVNPDHFISAHCHKVAIDTCCHIEMSLHPLWTCVTKKMAKLTN